MPVVLRATIKGFFGEEGRLWSAARMLETASWQMVGSSKVGLRGFGEKMGGRPMPERMSWTVALAVLFADLEGGARVFETLCWSRISPSIMVRCASMVLCGMLRSSRRVSSLEDERLTVRRVSVIRRDAELSVRPMWQSTTGLKYKVY